MPSYYWKGIDLTGCIQKGVAHASSIPALHNFLMQQDIALLQASQKKTTSIFRPIRTNLKVQLFRQLATLLDAGVYLDDALSIIHEQTRHTAFKKVLQDCAADVVNGLPLYSALEKYADVFDPITIQLIAAGQQGSNLAQAFSLLADYHERRDQFRKQLRSAAFLPCITLLFFAVVCVVIFVAIVPMFTAMFFSLGQELPESTKRLQAISNMLTFKGLLGFGFLSFVTFFVIKKIIFKTNMGGIFDSSIFKVPLFGRLLLESKITYFLQACSLLMHGGVPIVIALENARINVTNTYLHKIFKTIQTEVDKGKSLSSVMHNYPALFSSDIIALIRVGEESATLNAMIDKAVHVYRANVGRKLHVLTTVFQPLLMIFLGFMIMALILSVYIPIFDLSYAIH
jgi:type II secretory pathway component PulF